MTPTEISEHADHVEQAYDWWLKQVPNCTPGTHLKKMVQHGINLAVESKDKRIAELERDCKIWVDEVNEQITELQSKDREIERLTNLISKADFDWIEVSKELTEANAKLADAEEEISTLRDSMAWLQELHAVPGKMELYIDQHPDVAHYVATSFAHILSNAPNYCEMQMLVPSSGQRLTVTVRRENGKTAHELKAEVEAKLSSAQAEIEKYKSLFEKAVQTPFP